MASARLTIPSAVLLLVYLALSPIDDTLAAHGTSAFVLACLALLATRIILNLWVKRDRLPGGMPALAATGLCIFGPIFAALIWLNDPLLLQRLYSLNCLMFIFFASWGQLFNPGLLSKLPWFGRTEAKAQQDQLARIGILTSGMVLLLNETAIRYLGLNEWITVRAVLPILAYYLTWISVITMMDFGDEDGEDLG